MKDVLTFFGLALAFWPLVWLQQWSVKRLALRHMRDRERLSPAQFAGHYFQGPAVPMAERLLAVLAAVLPVDLSRLHPDDRLIEDLHMDERDSLSTVELVMEMEEELGIKISDEDAEQINTFRQMVEYAVSVTRKTA